MGWIVITAIAAILVVVGVLVLAMSSGRDQYGNRSDGRLLGVGLIVIPLILWVALSAFMSFRQVEPGYVGQVKSFGSFGEVVSNGTHVIAPWKQVQSVDVRTKQLKFKSNPSEGDLKSHDIYDFGVAASSDTQQVFFDLALSINVNPKTVTKLLSEFGSDWREVIIPARVAQSFKAEVRKYKAIDVISNREKIREDARRNIAEELAPYGVTVSDINVVEVNFTPEFNKLLEETVAAGQAAAKAQAEVAFREAEGRKAVADAQAAKNVAVENAQAEAQKVTIAAQAQADATKQTADAQAYATKAAGDAEAASNKAIAASLSPDVLQYQAILKLNPTLQTAILPSGSNTLLDPTRLLGGSPTP